MSEKGLAYIFPLLVVAVTLGVVIFVLLYQIAPTSNNIFRTLPFSNAATPTVTWSQIGGDGSKSGVNSSETILNLSTINNLMVSWQVNMPDYVDSSMVTASNVSTPQGTKDLVFVNGVSGDLMAYDQATGALIWSHQAPGGITNNQGTKSTPVIDPSGNFVYHYGNDGKVHKVDITNGQEITTGGFPATVSLHTADEKGSGSMSIGNGYVYAIMSGYAGDFGHYNGHIAAVNLSNGAVTVWNATCANIQALEPNVSGQANYCASIQSGIWGRGGAVIDPVDGSVYVATGNGPYNASTGGHDYGDSLIKLSPDLLTLKDVYTPSSFQNMQNTDQDLGSIGPAVLPTISNSNTPHLMVQGGKDHAVRLVNRDNLSGQGGINHVGGELQTITGINGDIVPQPAVWTDSSGQIWVFVVTTSKSDLYAYKVVTTSGTTQLQQAYHNANGGDTPVIANGLLYIQTSGSLKIIDPPTGNVLWNSSQHGISLGSAHWESPEVMNGRVFMVDESHNFTALGLSTAPTPSPAPTPAPGTNSFTGEYWNAGGGASPAIPNTTANLVRNDPTINFTNWGNGSPDPSINVDHFIARWTGNFSFQAGSYTFTSADDDGVRVYVDNQLIIDHWIDEGVTTYTATQTLTAGTHAIRMEYYENAGGAQATLSWQSNSTPTPTPTPTLAATPTPTPTSTPSTCPKGSLGDTDCNGTIDIFDFNNLVTNFGKTGVGISGGDLDGNGKVDIFDFNTLVTNFGK